MQILRPQRGAYVDPFLAQVYGLRVHAHFMVEDPALNKGSARYFQNRVFVHPVSLSL